MNDAYSEAARTRPFRSGRALASAAFFRERLGFKIDFLHGNPPFYARRSRAATRACIFAASRRRNFAELAG